MPKTDNSSQPSLSLPSSPSSVNSSWFDFQDAAGAQDSDTDTLTGSLEVEPADLPQTEWIYGLPWSTRDLIVFNLSQYTRLFYGEGTDAETRKRLANDNLDLYRIIDSLPAKFIGQHYQRKEKVALDLGFYGKLQIATTLMANQELLLELDTATDDRKAEVVKRNNNLILQLYRLQISFSNDPETELVSRGKQVVRSQEFKYAEELARLNVIIDDNQYELARLHKIIESNQSELSSRAKTNTELRQVIHPLETEIKRIKKAVGDVTELIGKLSLDMRNANEGGEDVDGVDGEDGDMRNADEDGEDVAGAAGAAGFQNQELSSNWRQKQTD